MNTLAILSISGVPKILSNCVNLIRQLRLYLIQFTTGTHMCRGAYVDYTNSQIPLGFHTSYANLLDVEQENNSDIMPTANTGSLL